MSHIIYNMSGDFLLGTSLLLLSASTYILSCQMDDLNRKVQNLNIHVKSLEASRNYNETRIHDLENTSQKVDNNSN